MADRDGLAGLSEALPLPPPGTLAAWLAVCFDVDGRAEGLIGRIRVDDVDDYY
jgi:hypothetical protein